MDNKKYIMKIEKTCQRHVEECQRHVKNAA